MRQFFKIAVTVLTLGFSIFLIQRACHEDGPKLDPNEKGGFAYARPKENLSPKANVPDEQFSFHEYQARRFDDRILKDRDIDSSSESLVREAILNRVHGDWVLKAQDNTRFELSISGETGSLKTYLNDSSKPVAGEQRVDVIAMYNLVLVTNLKQISEEENKDKSNSEANKHLRFSLFFNFKSNPSGDVRWRRNYSEEWLPLTVVSHTQ